MHTTLHCTAHPFVHLTLLTSYRPTGLERTLHRNLVTQYTSAYWSPEGKQGTPQSFTKCALSTTPPCLLGRCVGDVGEWGDELREKQIDTDFRFESSNYILPAAKLPGRCGPIPLLFYSSALMWDSGMFCRHVLFTYSSVADCLLT